MKFDYSEVIDLGFNRTECTDDVFFKTNGYRWFMVQLQIREYIFDWDSTDHTVSLVRYSKPLDKKPSANRMATVKMQSMEQLKFFINFLTSKKNKLFTYELPKGAVFIDLEINAC